eukprot:Nk52_evm14s273 gene=Nk52_evmTU14s273
MPEGLVTVEQIDAQVNSALSHSSSVDVKKNKWFGFAKLYASVGAYSKALAYAKEYLGLARDQGGLVNRFVGDLHFECGDLDDALVHYKRAVEISVSLRKDVGLNVVRILVQNYTASGKQDKKLLEEAKLWVKRLLHLSNVHSKESFEAREILFEAEENFPELERLLRRHLGFFPEDNKSRLRLLNLLIGNSNKRAVVKEADKWKIPYSFIESEFQGLAKDESCLRLTCAFLKSSLIKLGFSLKRGKDDSRFAEPPMVADLWGSSLVFEVCFVYLQGIQKWANVLFRQASANSGSGSSSWTKNILELFSAMGDCLVFIADSKSSIHNQLFADVWGWLLKEYESTLLQLVGFLLLKEYCSQKASPDYLEMCFCLLGHSSVYKKVERSSTIVRCTGVDSGFYSKSRSLFEEMMNMRQSETLHMILAMSAGKENGWHDLCASKIEFVIKHVANKYFNGKNPFGSISELEVSALNCRLKEISWEYIGELDESAIVKNRDNLERLLWLCKMYSNSERDPPISHWVNSLFKEYLPEHSKNLSVCRKEDLSIDDVESFLWILCRTQALEFMEEYKKIESFLPMCLLQKSVLSYQEKMWKFVFRAGGVKRGNILPGGGRKSSSLRNSPKLMQGSPNAQKVSENDTLQGFQLVQCMKEIRGLDFSCCDPSLFCFIAEKFNAVKEDCGTLGDSEYLRARHKRFLHYMIQSGEQAECSLSQEAIVKPNQDTNQFVLFPNVKCLYDESHISSLRQKDRACHIKESCFFDAGKAAAFLQNFTLSLECFSKVNSFASFWNQGNICTSLANDAVHLKHDDPLAIAYITKGIDAFEHALEEPEKNEEEAIKESLNELNKLKHSIEEHSVVNRSILAKKDFISRHNSPLDTSNLSGVSFPSPSKGNGKPVSSDSPIAKSARKRQNKQLKMLRALRLGKDVAELSSSESEGEDENEVPERKSSHKTAISSAIPAKPNASNTDCFSLASGGSVELITKNDIAKPKFGFQASTPVKAPPSPKPSNGPAALESLGASSASTKQEGGIFGFTVNKLDGEKESPAPAIKSAFATSSNASPQSPFGSFKTSPDAKQNGGSIFGANNATTLQPVVSAFPSFANAPSNPTGAFTGVNADVSQKSSTFSFPGSAEAKAVDKPGVSFPASTRDSGPNNPAFSFEKGISKIASEAPPSFGNITAGPDHGESSKSSFSFGTTNKVGNEQGESTKPSFSFGTGLPKPETDSTSTVLNGGTGFGLPKGPSKFPFGTGTEKPLGNFMTTSTSESKSVGESDSKPGFSFGVTQSQAASAPSSSSFGAVPGGAFGTSGDSSVSVSQNLPSFGVASSLSNNSTGASGFQFGTGSSLAFPNSNTVPSSEFGSAPVGETFKFSDGMTNGNFNNSPMGLAPKSLTFHNVHEGAAEDYDTENEEYDDSEVDSEDYEEEEEEEEEEEVEEVEEAENEEPTELSNDDEDVVEEECGAHFNPVIELPEVEVITMEENEDEIIDMRSKLFRMDKDTNQWKERGVGQVKILKHKETGKIRLLMRRDKTLKICANHYLRPGMCLQPMVSTEKAWIWNVFGDFADEEPTDETFAIRFGSLENAHLFKSAFDKCVKEVEEEEGDGNSLDDGSSVAGSDDNEKSLVSSPEPEKTEKETESNKFTFSFPSSGIDSKPASDTKETLVANSGGGFSFSFPTSAATFTIGAGDSTAVSDSEDAQVPSNFQPITVPENSTVLDFPETTSKAFEFSMPLSSLNSNETPANEKQGSRRESVEGKAEDEKSECDSENEADEEEPDVHFEPIVELPEVEVQTMEEDEEVLLKLRAKLYRFDKETNQWKERGVGEVKLLQHKETNKIRLLMRRDKTLKICANHVITKDMELCMFSGSEKAWLWTVAADLVDGEVLAETLAIRFGTIDEAQKFKAEFGKCAEAASTGTESRPSDMDAGSKDITNNSEASEEDKKNSLSGGSGFSFGKGTESSSFSFPSYSGDKEGQFEGKKFSFNATAPQPSHSTHSDASSCDEEDDDDDAAHDPQFQPIIELSEVEVQTMEEDEDVLFEMRAKLYRFDKDTSQWKERGVGNVKFLKHKETGKIRLLMRREKTLKICANHYFYSDMKLTSHQGSEKNWCWFTNADFTDGEVSPEQFVIRLGSAENADKFKVEFENCVRSVKANDGENDSHALNGSEDKSVLSETPVAQSDVVTADTPNEFNFKLSPSKFVFDKPAPAVKMESASGKPAFGVGSGSSLGSPLKTEGGISSSGFRPSDSVIDSFKKANEDKAKEDGIKGNGSVGKEIKGFHFPGATPKALEGEKFNESKSSEVAKGFSFGTSNSSTNGTDNPTKAPDVPSGFVFGSNSGSSFASFASVAPSGFNALSSNDNSPFGGSKTATIFGAQKEQGGNSDDGDDDGSEESADEEEDVAVDFKPIVDLPLVDVKTMEENEDVLFKMRAKLFRFDKDTSQWKERGLGEVKFLKHKETEKIRLLMRREKTLKICANHYIDHTMTLSRNVGSEKSWVWNVVADVSDGEPKPEQLAIRFANIENAEAFKKAFEESVIAMDELRKGDVCTKERVGDGDQISGDTTRSLETATTNAPVSAVESSKSAVETSLDTPEEKKGTGGFSTGLFSAAQGNGLSFASLASNVESKGFGGNSNFSFGSGETPKLVFGSATKSNAEEDGSDGEGGVEDECKAEFKPIISLPEVEVKTMEEDENVLYEMRCKLFRFDKETSQWKERGVGNMKFLQHRDTKKIRLLMRRDQTHKICCNHYLSPDLVLDKNMGSEKSWVWNVPADFSENEPRPELLAIRFKNAEIAEEFKAKFEEYQAIVEQLPKTSALMESKVVLPPTNSKPKQELLVPLFSAAQCTLCTSKNEVISDLSKIEVLTTAVPSDKYILRAQGSSGEIVLEHSLGQENCALRRTSGEPFGVCWKCPGELAKETVNKKLANEMVVVLMKDEMGASGLFAAVKKCTSQFEEEDKESTVDLRVSSPLKMTDICAGAKKEFEAASKNMICSTAGTGAVSRVKNAVDLSLKEDGLEIVGELQPTEEQIQRAAKWQLPKGFYLYETLHGDKEDCECCSDGKM